MKERELRQRKYSKSLTIFMMKKQVLYVKGRCYGGALDSLTNLELFELYIIDGLLYPEGDKSRDIPLDRCRLYRSGLESP